jgi:hypothetical protein
LGVRRIDAQPRKCRCMNSAQRGGTDRSRLPSPPCGSRTDSFEGEGKKLDSRPFPSARKERS